VIISRTSKRIFNVKGLWLYQGPQKGFGQYSFLFFSLILSLLFNFFLFVSCIIILDFSLICFLLSNIFDSCSFLIPVLFKCVFLRLTQIAFLHCILCLFVLSLSTIMNLDHSLLLISLILLLGNLSAILILIGQV